MNCEWHSAADDDVLLTPPQPVVTDRRAMGQMKVWIEVLQLASRLNLKYLRKFIFLLFYHIFVSPWDAPVAITLNVVWMEREFDAYKLSRSMCASVFNSFPVIRTASAKNRRFHHHHHHHHRCMLDVGCCPLCPDPSIRGRALLCSQTSLAGYSTSCPVLIRTPWRWETLPLLPTKNSMV